MPSIDYETDKEVYIDSNYDGVVMLSQNGLFFNDAETRPDGRKVFHIFERPMNDERIQDNASYKISEEHRHKLCSKASENTFHNIQEILGRNGIGVDEWCPSITENEQKPISISCDSMQYSETLSFSTEVFIKEEMFDEDCMILDKESVENTSHGCEKENVNNHDMSPSAEEKMDETTNSVMRSTENNNKNNNVFIKEEMFDEDCMILDKESVENTSHGCEKENVNNHDMSPSAEEKMDETTNSVMRSTENNNKNNNVIDLRTDNSIFKTETNDSNSDEIELKFDPTNIKTYKNKNRLKDISDVNSEKSDLKPYECSYCNYSAKVKQNLKSHMMIHKNYKRFTCSSCAYVTNYTSCVKIHRNKHPDHTFVDLNKSNSIQPAIPSAVAVFNSIPVNTVIKPDPDSIKDKEPNHDAIKDKECTLIKSEPDSVVTEQVSSDPATAIAKESTNEVIGMRLNSATNIVKDSTSEGDTEMKSTSNIVSIAKPIFKKVSEKKLKNINSGAILKLKNLKVNLTKLDDKKLQKLNNKLSSKANIIVKRQMLNSNKLKKSKYDRLVENKPLLKSLECPYTHIYRSKIIQHNLTHQKNKIYPCQDCDFTAKCMYLLKKHKLDHTEKKLLTCEYCIFVTHNEPTYKKHLRKKHAGKKKIILKCENCSYTTCSKSELQEHKWTHQKILKMFRCTSCNFATTNKSFLYKHKLEHPEPKEKSFKCCDCSYTTRDKRELMKHSRITHEKQRETLRCRKCPFATTNKGNLIKHLKSHKSKEKFKCYECLFVAKNKTFFMEHIRSHVKREIFDCVKCPFRTNFKLAFIKHKMTHFETIKDIYMCPECSFVSGKEKLLQTHILNHVYTKMHKCHRCEFSSDSRSTLRIHLKTHEAVIEKRNYRLFRKNKLTVSIISKNHQSYKCFKCEYSCGSEHLLKQHALTHLEIKMMKCAHCDYETNFKGNLVKHVLIHVDEYIIN